MPATTVTGQPLWFLHDLVYIRLDAEESEGTLDVIEMEGRRGEMPPLHVHHREHEYFVVLEGEMSVHFPDASRTLRAGEAGFAPMGVPHVYRIESERARWLALSSPAGFSKFVAAVADPAATEELPPADRPIDQARLGAAAEAAGIELLAPPGTMP